MKFKSVLNAFCVLLIASLIASCNKNSDSGPQGKYQHGVFIVNEGGINNGNASISFYNPDSLKVTNDLFTIINGRALGDVAESMSSVNDKFYLVINNSNKIEIADDNFTSIGFSKDSIDQPRFLLNINNQKAYISQWGSSGKGNVAVLDLTTNKVTKKITLNQGPEKMILYNNFVYVINAGGLTSDSTVSVIDANTDKLITNIKVGYNPSSILLDKNNKIWVLCGGMWPDKVGSLVQIDPSDNKVKITIPLASEYYQPPMTINQTKDKLVFSFDNKVYEQNIATTTPTVKLNRAFYKMGINPKNGDLYGTDPKNYTSDGWVFRYNSSFAVIDSFKVGVIPGEIMFN